MVNDTYRELSFKNNTRNQRGEDHIKTVVEEFEQYMPAGMKLNEFLRDAKTNEELLNTIVKFIKSNKGRQLINLPFIVTAGDRIKRVTRK